MPKVLRAPEACRAVKTGCDASSGLLPSMVASAKPVDAVLSPSWLMGEESDPTEELLWKSAVSSGIQGVMGCAIDMRHILANGRDRDGKHGRVSHAKGSGMLA